LRGLECGDLAGSWAGLGWVGLGGAKMCVPGDGSFGRGEGADVVLFCRIKWLVCGGSGSGCVLGGAV
jgi:hypothetical protein